MPQVGWFQFLVLLGLAVVPAFGSVPPPRQGFTFDADTWWHLRTGQWIVEHGTVPSDDPYSRLGGEQPVPWVAYSWLYEVVLFEVHDHFGPGGILTLRVLLAGMSIAALFLTGLSRRTWSVPILGAIWLAGFVLFPLMAERPWHFSIVGSAIVLGVVQQLRQGTLTILPYWLGLVFLLWANLHIQFVLGWLILGVALIFPRQASRRTLALLLALCVGATLINPYHVRLFVVIAEYATQTGPLRTVRELAPPDWTHPWTWAAFALLGWAAFATIRRRPIDGFSVALLILATILTLRMRRDVWVGGLVSLAILRESWPLARHGSSPRMIILAVLVTVIGGRVMSGISSPADKTMAAQAKIYPVKTVEFIKEQKLQGPLYNHFDWGGYLIWALPGEPVAIDGRTNVYGSERVLRSMAVWAGEQEPETDPDYVSARLIIAPVGRPLTEKLRARPDQWQIRYEDDLTVVFTRR